MPASIIHHLLHPTNSLITKWSTLIQRLHGPQSQAAPPRLRLHTQRPVGGIRLHEKLYEPITRKIKQKFFFCFQVCFREGEAGNSGHILNPNLNNIAIFEAFETPHGRCRAVSVYKLEFCSIQTIRRSDSQYRVSDYKRSQ